ncbi:hypothetical protein L7F22_047871 [Adiantum nelumboides]|nr:hypothetical protein [Adiantum nelumboides]
MGAHSIQAMVLSLAPSTGGLITTHGVLKTILVSPHSFVSQEVVFAQLVDMLMPALQQGCIPEPLLTINGCVFTVEWKVAIALMHLATGCSFNIVSEKFGYGKSTVSKIVDNLVDAMLPFMRNVIKWPSTPVEIQSTKAGMQSFQGLPNCMGAIDCTHVKWIIPEKSWPATGFPGPANDKRVLQNNSFFRLAQGSHRLQGPVFHHGGCTIREYIIRDDGYYQLPWLLIPFQEPCSVSQSRYKYRLSLSHTIVEHAFGRLKNAWRILAGVIKNPCIIKVPKIIVVCCMLHNLAIDHGMAVDNKIDGELDAYHDHVTARQDVTRAVNAETVVMFLDELHGTHL